MCPSWCSLLQCSQLLKKIGCPPWMIHFNGLSLIKLVAPPSDWKIDSPRFSALIFSALQFRKVFTKDIFFSTLAYEQVPNSTQFSLIGLFLNLFLWETIDDLKRECTSVTCIRAIVNKVTWLAAVLACIIERSSVHTRTQCYILFGASLGAPLSLLSKSVSHMSFFYGIFYCHSYEKWIVDSRKSHLLDGSKIQGICGHDRIFIPAHVASIPQLLQ